jgi:hypothetical protein
MYNRRQCGVQAANGALLAVLSATTMLAAGSAYALRSAARSNAHAAQALRATDIAHLRYISASGSLLYEQGRATGTLSGRMRVHLRVSTTFSGSFTIYTSSGSITGHGSARPHGSGVYESFAGTLVVTAGSGRFRHARGRAGLYGTFNRNTYALVVQTTGTLYY